MKIIIDSREQAPLKFKHAFVKGIINNALDVGDYAALFSDGHLCPVIFERKSVPDLYGTLSQGYDRFKREMGRAKESGIKLIIIVEGSLTRVLHGAPYSARTPESLVYQLFTIRVRYGVETVFCNNRDEVAEFISQYYIALFKEYEVSNVKNQGASNEKVLSIINPVPTVVVPDSSPRS